MASKPRVVALTGAVGRIGTHVRQHIGGKYDWRHLDIEPLPDATDSVVCDIRDFEATKKALDGVDAVVHLAYVYPSVYAGAPDDVAREAASMMDNIQGTYNVFEAARLGGARRIVFASSNHAVGMYEIKGDLPIDHRALPRPDSLYGAYKCASEALGRFYWDQYGISVYCLRIGTVPHDEDRPKGDRNRATWISGRDIAHLIDCCLTADHEGFEIFYGISRNAARFWDIEHAVRTVGYDPQDRAEDYFPPESSGP